MDAGVKYDALKLAEDLRARGIPTEFLYHAKNLGRQLKEAGDLDVEYVVIYGGQEWDRGEVMLKNFRTREQESVRAETAAEVVAGRLG